MTREDELTELRGQAARRREEVAKLENEMKRGQELRKALYYGFLQEYNECLARMQKLSIRILALGYPSPSIPGEEGPDLSPIPDCSRVCKCELPKPRRVAGKLTLKQVRQHALKVGRDAEAGLRRDRAEESRRAAGKGRGK